MGFHEYAGHARGHGCAREQRDMLALAAGRCPARPGLLHRVRGVEDDGAARGAQDRERAHVDDEIVVAERDAALADEQRLVARRACLVDDAHHLPRREELAFLQIDGLAEARDGDDEVRLPAEQRRRLQHVDDRSHLVERRVLVDIRQHRDAELGANSLEDAQTAVEAESAEACRGAAIRLVERRFEDERNAKLRGDRFQALGRAHDERLALDDARAGDQKKRSIRADLDTREPHALATRGSLSPWHERAAVMKLVNSG
jgi:hypothetical protein